MAVHARHGTLLEKTHGGFRGKADCGRGRGQAEKWTDDAQRNGRNLNVHDRTRGFRPNANHGYLPGSGVLGDVHGQSAGRVNRGMGRDRERPAVDTQHGHCRETSSLVLEGQRCIREGQPGRRLRLATKLDAHIGSRRAEPERGRIVLRPSRNGGHQVCPGAAHGHPRLGGLNAAQRETAKPDCCGLCAHHNAAYALKLRRHAPKSNVGRHPRRIPLDVDRFEIESDAQSSGLTPRERGQARP